jgi:hypothetical protein
MFCELFGPLIGLDEEWKAQGAKPGELDLSDFCFDYVPVAATGAVTGLLGGYKTETISEDERCLISKDALGRTMKLIKGAATIPLPLDYPVSDMASWQKIKPFFTYSDKRIDKESLLKAANLQKEGVFIIEWIPGGYDMPRELMGEEMLSYAVYDQPELIRDMVETFADTARKVLELACEYVVPDCLCVHEDMAGKSGPMFGPAQINEFIRPYYGAVWDLLKKKGTTIFSQDSDGNMNPVMDLMVDCGINLFYPLEPAAGMDMVRLREKYGRNIFFKGGIDKHVIREGKAAIAEELRYKLSPILKEGGCVFALDHRIPNGTSLDNYRYYVDSARSLLDLPPRNSDEKGWARMAF